LPYYEQHFQRTLPDSIKQRLLTISPATIDRLMAPMRSKFNKLGLATTKPGSILKKYIPIRTNQWDENRPGFLEADTVAHCGTSVGGMFVYTVNVVDLAIGWRLLMNFFLPSTKLVEKYRDRSRIIKRYDRPQTPYQRILKSKAIPRKSKQELEQLFKTLNPFDIQQTVQRKIMDFLNQTTPIQQEIQLRKTA